MYLGNICLADAVLEIDSIIVRFLSLRPLSSHMGSAIWALMVRPNRLIFFLFFLSNLVANFYVLLAAQAALESIFKKREAAASKAVATEVPRTKRPRKEGDPLVIEKVPAFLTPRPVAVDEDPNPYVIEWGLLKKDTVVGDSRAAAEWSRNVVTPRDRAHVVESSDDLQIELLGAQAVATVRLEIFPLLRVFCSLRFLPCFNFPLFHR